MPIRFAPPCDRCGSQFLAGTNTTCTRCLRSRGSPNHRWRTRLRCDCGKKAVVVILVRIGLPDIGFSLERLALCRECLAIERETQKKLDRLGYGGNQSNSGR